jgi:hypothetical protein
MRRDPHQAPVAPPRSAGMPLTALAIVAFVVAGACGDPTRTPTPVPTAPSASTASTAPTALPTSPPEDAWVVNASKAFHYTMAHPPGWTVEASKTEDAYAIDGQPYVYVAPQRLADGTTVDDFVADLQAFYKDDFGQPVSQVARSLGAQPGYRLVYQFTNDQGEDVTFVDDVSVRGRTGWEVFLVTAGGTSDIPVFDQFVATFHYTD